MASFMGAMRRANRYEATKVLHSLGSNIATNIPYYNHYYRVGGPPNLLPVRFFNDTVNRCPALQNHPWTSL